MSRDQPSPSVLVPLFALVCAGIVYGSLFPFRFSVELAGPGLSHFLASWRTVNSSADALGNLALFFPFGYMACLIAGRSERPRLAALLLCLFGIALAVACQLAQSFTVGRDPSIFDLYMNGLGVALGWLGGRVLPLGSSGTVLGGNPRHHVALVVAASWLACQLLPFVPGADVGQWWESLTPLLRQPRLRWQEVLLLATAWLMFFHMLHFHAGLRVSGVRALCVGLIVVLLQIVIVRNHLSLNEVLGLAAGLVVWSGWGRRLSGYVLAWALLVAFALDVLAPLLLRSSPRSFGWLPFDGYLRGSMLVNAIALCRKTFVFAALVLYLVEPRARALHWALGLALLLLLLEMAQRFIGLGTPTLTDPLLFLLLSWLIHRQLTRYSSA